MSQESLTVSFIPDRDFHDLMQEVDALPLRKRCKWHGTIRSTDGTNLRVRFIDGQLVFKYCSEQITLKPESDQYLNDIEFLNPVYEAQHERLNRAYQRGGYEAASAEFDRITREEATGNHRSKPRKIKVPTKAGEPVRA
jgi:hypothetical protein